MSREADFALHIRMNANGASAREGRRTERTVSQMIFLSEAKREVKIAREKGK